MKRVPRTLSTEHIILVGVEHGRARRPENHTVRMDFQFVFVGFIDRIFSHQELKEEVLREALVAIQEGFGVVLVVSVPVSVRNQALP